MQRLAVIFSLKRPGNGQTGPDFTPPGLANAAPDGCRVRNGDRCDRMRGIGLPGLFALRQPTGLDKVAGKSGRKNLYGRHGKTHPERCLDHR